MIKKNDDTKIVFGQLDFSVVTEFVTEKNP